MDRSRHTGTSTGKTDHSHLYIYFYFFQGAVQIDFFLRDGVRICQLINKIKPSAICKQEIVTGTTEANRTNILNFLKAAELYGVPARFLFEVQICLKYS